MSIARINGLPRVQPVLELGIGDSRTHDVAAQWDVDEWDDVTAQWSGVEPYWVDVTCYGHEMQTFTGHDRATEVWEVGTATVLLDNRNGWADYPPTSQATLDYFLRVRPGVQIRIGVLVDGVYHGKFRGFIDQANPGYDPELGETVTLECIDAKGEAGRGDLPKTNLTAEVTTKSLTSNVAQLVVAKHSAVVGDTVIVALNPADAVFDGSRTVTSVTATTISYSRTNANVASIAAKGTVTVTTPEYVHERIERILGIQYWPPEWSDLESSGIRLVATELGQPAVDAINRASDSGGGSVFGDLNGKVRYRNYGWLDWSPDEPEDGSIGNVQGPVYDEVEVPLVENPAGSGLLEPPTGSINMGSDLFLVPDAEEDPKGSSLYHVVLRPLIKAGDVCPTGWELSFARADFSNRVLIGRSDMDEPLMYEDVTDRSQFGVEPFKVTDLWTEVEGEMTALAQRILRARDFALAPRIAAVGLNAATGDDVIDLLAKIDPRNPSRVLCRHRADDGRMVFNKMCFVTGIRHTFTPDSWEARVALDDATPWAIGISEAQWDVDEWDQEQWAKVPQPI